METTRVVPAIHTLLRALPLGALTLAYAGSVAGISLPLSIDADELSHLFMLEFLAIHSFPFMIFVINSKPVSRAGKIVRLLGAAFLTWIYLVGAYSMAEWNGVLALLPLIGGTYFGFLLKGIRRDDLPELIIRFAVNFIGFMGSALIFDLPTGVEDWAGMPETVQAGLLYFLLLTILEAGGWAERWGEKVRGMGR